MSGHNMTQGPIYASKRLFLNDGFEPSLLLTRWKEF